MMTFADRAAPLVAQGIPVFPCWERPNGKHSNGKNPRTRNGFKDATTDAQQLAAWSSQWPDALVGVPTGKASGLFVLDVDVKNGKNGFDTLRAKGWVVPKTRTHHTLTGGGVHYLFRLPDGVQLKNSAGVLGDGLDTRGEGGYVIWWPAHGGEVEHADIVADVPPFLVDALRAPAPRTPAPGIPAPVKPAPASDATDGGSITEGRRNDTLFRLAASLRGKGLTVAAIEAALLIENEAKCRPPLSAEEVRTIARSTGRYEGGLESSWSQPKPIIAELKPVPGFDSVTLLPEPLRAWVMDEAERMPCPPEYVAAAALVALGSIIGARCAIRPKARDSWLIVPNLWGGIVGEPSAKKSPAWGVALRPLDPLIAKAQEEYNAALANYEAEKFVFDAHKEAIESRIKAAVRKPNSGDLAALISELRALRAQEPAVPVMRRYKTNDSTIEKLGELLRDNPTGLLVLRDELVGLIATWEREGREGERAFFLEAWNGNQSFDTDRIGRGHIFIPNLSVSIFGGIQPDKLTVYLEQAANALANDGMLQRFQILVYPDPRRWEWRDRAPDKAARDAAYAIFKTLADCDPVSWGAAPADDFAKFPAFHFDDEAQAVFVEWSGDLHCNRIPNEDEPIIRQHLAKYDKLFPALALIFHLVEGAAEGVRGPVTKDAALRAAAWCEFLEAHARRCYGLLKDDGLRAAQALAAKLESGALEDGFTLRDVRRNQWRHLTTDEAIQAALDWLEDEDWLRSETSGGKGPGTGRRTVRYWINPAVKSKKRPLGSTDTAIRKLEKVAVGAEGNGA